MFDSTPPRSVRCSSTPSGTPTSAPTHARDADTINERLARTTAQEQVEHFRLNMRDLLHHDALRRADTPIASRAPAG